MGRYYSGDIEGKFWFGVQSSDCADRFGVTGQAPDYLEYNFTDIDSEDIEDEIFEIKKKLGEKLKVLQNFFEANKGYNDQMLKDANISDEDVSEYADLLLGERIKECIDRTGECNFQAEF